MNSAAKLIDFFVHDILDYTILKTTLENFKKNCEIFEMLEIHQILHDKADLKQIQVNTIYKGLKVFRIKTD